MTQSPVTGPATKPRVGVPKQRPDPTALRLVIGFVGIAASSAMVSSMLAPAPMGTTQTSSVQVAPAREVVHVVKYVQLQPGQTAPPQAVVQQQQAPAPKTVIVTTRQSGAKP